MSSRYDTKVVPDRPNNAHAFALQLVGGNKRVLELGAASGHVTRQLVSAGCSVTCVEFEPEAAAGLVGVADHVVVGDLNDPSTLDGLAAEFDVVLAGDVLEHLHRPQIVLDRAVRLLVPGGRVVVSVPNVAHADIRLMLLSGQWRYASKGLLDETHVHFFTLESLQRLVRRAGLVITELRRVRVPAFETELDVARDSVPTSIVDFVLKDPEAETYQFVFSATRESGDLEQRRLIERNVELQRQLDLALVRAAAAESRKNQEPSRARRVAGRAYRGLRRLLR